MSAPLFVSLDGPKGVGKTTLLEAIARALRLEGHKVVRLSERNHDPFRAQTMALVNAFARAPCVELELRICEQLADSRAWISRHVLPNQLPGSIILMDRWYASDAAFRRTVSFADIQRLNLERGVQVPDLQVAVITRSELSWARAQARRGGLRSTVLQSAQGHAACTDAFEQAMAGQDWLVCRNEGALEVATAQVVAGVRERLKARADG